MVAKAKYLLSIYVYLKRTFVFKVKVCVILQFEMIRLNFQNVFRSKKKTRTGLNPLCLAYYHGSESVRHKI